MHAPTRYLTGTFVFNRIYILPNPESPKSASGSKAGAWKQLASETTTSRPAFYCITFPLFLPANRSTGMPSQEQMEPVSFLGLPIELHGQVIDNLSFPDNVSLKATCRYFSDLIIFEHAEQIKAESSLYAFLKDLYACCGCSRLRFSHKFADNMLKKKRRRGEPEASRRFCIECGTAPQGEKSSTRYCPGAHIQIQGVHHVICLDCRHFARGVSDGDGTHTPFCPRCWTRRERFRVGLAKREEEHRQAEERMKLKQEQAWRREARRAAWGSDYEDSDDGPEPSPTWTELHMDIVQAEAAGYMNSPKAGSE